MLMAPSFFNVNSSLLGQDDGYLLPLAIDVVIGSGFGSAALLSQEIRSGFGRAERPMELYEENRFAGSTKESKSQKVLMSPLRIDATE